MRIEQHAPDFVPKNILLLQANPRRMKSNNLKRLVVSHLFSLFLSGCFLVFLYYTGVDKKLPGSFFGLKYFGCGAVNGIECSLDVCVCHKIRGVCKAKNIFRPIGFASFLLVSTLLLYLYPGFRVVRPIGGRSRALGRHRSEAGENLLLFPQSFLHCIVLIQ